MLLRFCVSPTYRGYILRGQGNEVEGSATLKILDLVSTVEKVMYVLDEYVVLLVQLYELQEIHTRIVYTGEKEKEMRKSLGVLLPELMVNQTTVGLSRLAMISRADNLGGT